MSSPWAESAALEIWLIQDAITATFRIRDFYNCLLVSKAWNRIFTPAFWKVIECRGPNSLVESQFLLNPESTLHQPKFYRLVQELTIWGDGHLPLFHPLPQSPPLLQGTNASKEQPQQQGKQPWIDSPDPDFPNLKVLQWAPCLSMVFAEQPPAHELNLLRFLQVHQNTLHTLFLQIWNLDEAIFKRLCSVLEAMPTLRRVTLEGVWIHTSEQVQRFFWACRHLGSSYLPHSSHSVGRVDIFGGGMVMNAAVQLLSEYYTEKPEALFPLEEPAWSPIFEPTQIRSLNLAHGVARKFWIYVPVFRMCPFLERLELQIQELEGLVPMLRECLHSSCPLLKVLKITREFPKWTENVPLNWSLGLLCPGIDEERAGASAMDIFQPISPLHEGELPAINRDLVYGMDTPLSSKTHPHSCPGFRLKTFQLSERCYLKHKVAISNYPRPWRHLLDHHGPTLTNLDLFPIVMPLQEFVDVASAGEEMPHLLSLTAVVVWTVDEQASLSATILTEKGSRRPQFQQQYQDQPCPLPPNRPGETKQTRMEALLESMGLRSWTACRGLSTLKLKISQSEPKGGERIQERVLLEYLVHEICQSSALEKLTVKTDDIPWLPVMTLPGSVRSTSSNVPTNSTVTEAPSTTIALDIVSGVETSDENESSIVDVEGDEAKMGEEEARVGGYLDQFSNLCWIKEVTWMQPQNVVLTVQDAAWILAHWPCLYFLNIQNKGCYGADQAGFDLLEMKRLALMENSEN